MDSKRRTGSPSTDPPPRSCRRRFNDRPLEWRDWPALPGDVLWVILSLIPQADALLGAGLACASWWRAAHRPRRREDVPTGGVPGDGACGRAAQRRPLRVLPRPRRRRCTALPRPQVEQNSVDMTIAGKPWVFRCKEVPNIVDQMVKRHMQLAAVALVHGAAEAKPWRLACGRLSRSRR
ncbi:hypothetical protein ZWY2020_049974 [Hordeum vulgare]|nr:hypothetical protein ZWY2020_049974 [Hordeum vulgare]